MKTHQREWTWLDASETINASELARACAISIAELDELVGYGAVNPLELRAQEALFSAGCVPALRHACKLGQDFDLDLFTVGLLIDYLNRIDALQREIRFLRAHLPKHVLAAQREGPQPWTEPHAGGPGGAAPSNPTGGRIDQAPDPS